MSQYAQIKALVDASDRAVKRSVIKDHAAVYMENGKGAYVAFTDLDHSRMPVRICYVNAVDEILPVTGVVWGKIEETTGIKEISSYKDLAKVALIAMAKVPAIVG